MYSNRMGRVLAFPLMLLLLTGFSCEKDDEEKAEPDMAARRREMMERYANADSATKAKMREEYMKRHGGKPPEEMQRPEGERAAGEGQEKKPGAQPEAQQAMQRGGHPGMVQQPGEALIPVEVSRIERSDVADYILASTTLEALREVEVYAKTTGIIEHLLVEEGDYVRGGDTLVVLDDREARLDLRKAEISFREAENALKRSREMSSRDLISQEEHETVQLSFESSKTNLEEARLAFEYTRVTAPIDGVITERFIELGDMITQSKILFHLADFNPLRARIFIPEKELPRLRVGQEVLLRVESAPGKEFPAVVQLISAVIDPSSGTFKVTVEVKSEGGELRPGMFASARIIVDRHLGAKVVPAEAVLYEGRQRYIYVVRDGVAVRVDLEAGYADEGRLEVIGSVDAGELIVVAGQNNLANGTKVEIVRDVSGGTTDRNERDKEETTPPTAERGSR